MEFFFGAFEKEWERRRAAILHDRARGNGSQSDDEPRKRRGTVAVSPGGSFGRIAGRKPRSVQGKRTSSTEPSMRSRFRALASGSQPAVVKLASFGSGARLGAMINYVSRNGEVAVENERGQELRGRDEISMIRGEWNHLMKNRAESRDIGTFAVDITGGFDPGGGLRAQARALLKSGLGDRRFAFAIKGRENGYTIEGVTVLRDSNGERLTADNKASRIVADRLDAAFQDKVWFRFTAHGNGTDYGTSRLRSLVDRHDGAVEDEAGRKIGDAQLAGDIVQLEWRGQLHSRRSRDVMHLILSARVGTDVGNFRSAARDFLAAEFGGHRYVFSLHDPSLDPKPEDAGGKRPHVHVHAVVAMRNDDGKRVESSIRTFRRWRVTLAEKAREHGIDMEMTDRRDRASAPSYGRNQVRPTSRIGRTEHVGTSLAAQARYQSKRVDQPNLARTNVSLDYSRAAWRHWSRLIHETSAEGALTFAKDQLSRLEAELMEHGKTNRTAASRENPLSQLRTNLVNLVEAFSEDRIMRPMTRDEFRAYERRVEDVLSQAQRTIPDGQRGGFEEIVSAVRDHVDARREMMELQQRNREQSPAIQGEGDPDRGDDAKERWDRAVARHGARTVEAANRIMLEVEHYRDAIGRAEAGDIGADKAALQASLNLELARAGELGATGNSLIREIAEADDEIRIALEAARRSRDRGRAGDDAGENASVRRENDEADKTDHRPSGERLSDGGEAELLPGAANEKRRDRPAIRPGDTTRSDPAGQHVPRLEQLQRDADEDRERDDRDR
jgi:hypothetical protein